MSDAELRDATLAVEVQLPNGKTVSGRPIYFRTGMRIQGLLDTFVVRGTQKSFDEMWDVFTKETGVTEPMIKAACPDIGVSEILDLVRRFIYLLRPGRTAVQEPSTTPVSTTGRARSKKKRGRKVIQD